MHSHCCDGQARSTTSSRHSDLLIFPYARITVAREFGGTMTVPYVNFYSFESHFACREGDRRTIAESHNSSDSFTIVCDRGDPLNRTLHVGRTKYRELFELFVAVNCHIMGSYDPEDREAVQRLLNELKEQ